MINATQRAASRVNSRLMLGGFVTAAVSAAAYGGWSYTRPASPTGPTKQIATGIDPTIAGKDLHQPAVASLSDDAGSAAHIDNQVRQLQYSQPAESSSRRSQSSGNSSYGNSYLPTSNDPAGGTTAPSTSPYSASASPYSESASQYGSPASQYHSSASQYGQSTDAAPATLPADPTATAATTTAASPASSEPPPANPYRSDLPSSSGTSSAGIQPPATLPPLSQSPYAAATSTNAGGYGQPVADVSPRTTPHPIEPMAPAATIPVNPLPSAPATSPYARSLPQSTTSAAITSTAIAGSGLAASAASSLSNFSSGGMRQTGTTTLAAPTPGERQFEGPQQPSVALEKVSPTEIQVGKPATFALYVRNMGQVAAQAVTVTDHVPTGTQLVEARPQPQQSSDGSLVWNLGTMQPGEETQIVLQVMPQTEGEIGSTAHVTFAAAATSRSISTRPQLTIEQTAPPKVLIGEPLIVGITISNPGTGPASGVIIEEDVPAGLSHAAGSQLEYDVGVLRPGESKHLDLSLRAERAGIAQNRIQVRGDAGLAAQHVAQIEVVAPQLQVVVDGPKRRFLERQATYTLQINNPGTAVARDIDLIAYLPRGMKFVSTDSLGQYDPSQHAVLWSLAELQPGQPGAVKLTAIPVEPGEQKIQIEGRGALNLSAKAEQLVVVEQAAELVHTVKDVDEVIEVGSETTYEIRVTNTGTKAATNVRIAAIMPAGLAAITGDGPTRPSGDATQIAFAPLERLNPQEEVLYRVQVQSRAAGDQIVRVQLSADDLPTVTREESTRVYQDR
jgi:uncharacterized repeat protein (TIGR01451 family)